MCIADPEDGFALVHLSLSKISKPAVVFDAMVGSSGLREQVWRCGCNAANLV